MKKLLLALGTIATIATSAIAVVSCSSTPVTTKENPSVANTIESKIEVNKLLANEANKFSDEEPTDHSFLRVGGKELTTWNDGIINLEGQGGGDWSNSFAELRAGDYIDFVFDEASEINNFSERVFYDNTLSAKNISAGSTMESMYFCPPVVKDGKVVALPEATGTFQSEGAKGDVSIYSLKAVKKNVIRMTFNDIYEKETTHMDAQIIYLRGFSDINGDGKVDLKDEQMTPTFAIDGGVMYGNYQQPYVNTGKNYWHKGVTVGMHDQTIIDYLNK